MQKDENADLPRLLIWAGRNEKRLASVSGCAL